MGPERRDASQGAILILTLWVVALLTLMAHGVIFRARLGIREAEWADFALQARQLMRAASSLAVDRLAADDDVEMDSYQEPWGRHFRVDSAGLPAEWDGIGPGNGAFEIDIQPADEYGKVNVNLAPEDLLVAVLRECGAGPRATDIAKAIVDWRDEDDIGTAEQDLYENIEPPYAPSNTDLKSVDELLCVYGIDADLFFGEDGNHNGLLDPNEDDGEESRPPDNMDGRLQPGLIEVFTVYGDGAININTAPAPILRAVMRMAMDGDFAADAWADALLAKRRGPDDLDGTDDDTPFESEEELQAALAVLMGEDPPAQALRVASPFGVTGDAFRFYLRVRFPEKHFEKTAEVVMLRKDGRLTMLEYHDGDS